MDELLELEHQGWQSLCDGTGAEFYARVMTEQGVMVLAHGFVLDREAIASSLNESPPWRTYEISEPRTIELDPDSAVLVYTGSAERGDDEPPFRALMSSVYTRRDGSWRLAVYQQTPVPSEASGT